MSPVRIPKPVNRVLDAPHRHPRVTVAVVAGCALAWPVALYWASPLAAVIAGCGLLLFVGATVFTSREMRWRETVRQRDYDIAALNQIIKQLSAGDPSAPTAQLRPIGDRGEIT
jgi:Flp pilus assembly protein TadB